MPPSRSSVPWQAILVVALTAVLVWWFLRSVAMRDVWVAMAHARLDLVLAAVAVTIQTYVLRAWRWQTLLLPIGRVRFRNAFRTTVIGYAASNVLPGRVGEV